MSKKRKEREGGTDLRRLHIGQWFNPRSANTLVMCPDSGKSAVIFTHRHTLSAVVGRRGKRRRRVDAKYACLTTIWLPPCCELMEFLCFLRLLLLFFFKFLYARMQLLMRKAQDNKGAEHGQNACIMQKKKGKRHAMLNNDMLRNSPQTVPPPHSLFFFYFQLFTIHLALLYKQVDNLFLGPYISCSLP